MSFMRFAAICSVLAAGTGCGATDGPSGEIRMLTYNVAGLPAELSGSDPVANMPQISPMLNDYDLVLVQEDFWYHRELESKTEHPYKSQPMWEAPDWQQMGDGLNVFSSLLCSPVTRVAWETCNGMFDSGSDCLTTKGFLYTKCEPHPGLEIHVYNLHMDASGSDADIEARKVQARQLADFINLNSSSAAVLVGGDTNLKKTRPADLETLDEFLSSTGLVDSCRYLECGDERIDRILFRSSALLELEPVEWSIPSGFVDIDKNPLSDHEPVSCLISWRQF